MLSLALDAQAASRFDPLIVTAAYRYGLEPALVKAVINCESRFDPHAISRRGARGLMQLMPATQALLGVPNAFDPQTNIVAGVRYLTMLRRTFGDDVSLFLAAYNAGPQAVIAAGYAVPPFPETQRYVTCVLTNRDRYRQHGFNAQSISSSDMHVQTDEEPRIVVSPLRLSDKVAQVGRRLTLHLEVHHAGPTAAHGVVILTYPEPLVSFIALHTSERETTVRIPPAPNRQTVPSTWPATSYQFLQGVWSVWQPGQQRTAVFALIPRQPQDLALHLSVLLYDDTKTTVQHRWSTVVRIPVRPRTW